MKVVYYDKRTKCEKGVVYVNKAYIGKKINRWTLVEYDHSEQRGLQRRQFWLCRCECGTEEVKESSSIICGRSKSCGCIYKENKEKSRISRREASVRNKYSMYKNSAKNRNIKFKLTLEEFDDLVHGLCHYCNAKPSVRNFTCKKHKWSYDMNGVDRIDSEVDYEVSNCVPACDTCNRAKLDHSVEYFLDWIKRVYEKSL
jgi:hypothetical protein